MATTLHPTAERKLPAQASGAVFIPVFICFLLCLQTAYAYAYLRLPLLRTTILLPNAIRLGTWTLPVLAYLAYSRQNVLEYLELRQNSLRGVAWGLLIGLLLLAVYVSGTHFLRGHALINLHFSRVIWWKGVILVGFSEEVVFRGFLLPTIAKKTGFWIANLAQATVFFTIHVPGWILLGNSFPKILQSAASVLFVGAALGVVWRKSRSLWACILVHSFYNFCCFAIQ